MSDFFKSTRKLSTVLSALLLVITLATGSFAYMTNGLPAVEKSENIEQEEPVEQDPDVIQNDGGEPEPEEFEMAGLPGGVRGVILTPGIDFIKKEGASADTIRSEIDGALGAAKEIDVNAVVIDTVYNDRVIYKTSGANEFSPDFDIMEYLMVQCHEAGMYTYAIFDVSPYLSGSGVSTLAVGGSGTMDKLSQNAEEFAEKYGLDGILIDGYASADSKSSYSQYINTGGAIGFDNFIRQTPATAVKSVVKAIHRAAPGTQAGLLADAVWANDSDNAQGSATKAKYTSLSSGNADTKSYVERGIVDFVAVKAYSSLTDEAEPFGEVVSWWSKVAGKSDVPFYIIHASSKVGTQEAGWSSGDQLKKQLDATAELNGFYGSIFNNLQKLAGSGILTVSDKAKTQDAESSKDNKNSMESKDASESKSTNDSADTQKSESAPATQQVSSSTGIVVTKPEKLSFSTDEQTVTFAGSADPSAPLTLNDTSIDIDDNGYFAVLKPLSPGENQFTLTQNGKVYNYNITQKTSILREISPVGDVTAEGGTFITISAMAQNGASVYAMINGEKVSMAAEDSEGGYAEDSSYSLFVGDYITPEDDGDEVQNFGSVKVYASLNGQTESIDGADVSLYKTTSSSTKTPVVIAVDQALTYPPTTKNNIQSAAYYPLPKGALDYTVGESFTYKSPATGQKYSFVVLASGLRVETKDIKKTSTKVSNNKISGMTVSAKNDGYTYVSLKTAQKVSYTFSYKNDKIEILFHNTTNSPGNLNLNSNPLFTKAVWSEGNKLTLTLVKSGGFMGYKGYFDSNGNLVFRFNNPPTSIKNAKIAIDPGHGGKDTGALGSSSKWPEKVLTQAISKLLVEELESRGAKAVLLESAGYERYQRAVLAERTYADILVSVHCNTAKNTSATGTEVYYFYPFSRSLAVNSSANVSKKFNTVNRGAKQSYYGVTLSSQMASVLVECGFMTNKTEYAKLTKSKYQKVIASGIADGIVAAIKTANTGVKATGTQSVGSAVTAGAETSSKSSTTNSSLDDDSEYIDSDEYYDDEENAEEEDTSSSSDSASALASDTGITLSKAGDVRIYNDYMSMYPGTKQRVEILSEDDDLVRNRDFKWTSDDTSIATVDKYGNITAKKVGSATIVAKYGNDELFCDIEVTRTKTAVKSIKLDKTSLTLVRGKTEQLRPTITPLGATDKTIKWTTTNNRIASVDSNGIVTAKNRGTATITARTKDGNFTAKCEVTVLNKAPEIEYIEMSDSELDLPVGDEGQLEVYIYPEEAADAEVVWSSNKSNVVTVDADGVIKALKKGTATIKATSKTDKSVYDQCVITVY